MFDAIDDYCARSQRGVEVRLTRSQVVYTLGERATRIEFEYVIEEEAILLYESSLRRWEPSGGLVGSIERQQILKDVSEALDALGVRHQVRS